MPGEKKFNLGYENKAPFGFSRSVDAMGFVAMDLGAMWHCFCPYYHHQHPTLETDSPGLPAVSRWRLGPQRRMGLCPTIPKRDFWVQTLQGAERSKVNCLDSGCKKRGLCGGRISPAAPLPCLVTPWGHHRQAGGHTPAGSTSRQKLLR